LSAEIPVRQGRRAVLEVLWVALRLGLTSFGGPVAHLGYFRAEYVVRRRWLPEEQYADLVALCQFLPGPASSQVGIAVGITRAGLAGGVAAWVGFTLPSAVALTIFAMLARQGRVLDAGWLHGLQVVAVAVVAQAVWGMARTLTPDWPRALLAIGAASVALAWATPATQVALIAAGALVGWLFLEAPAPVAASPTIQYVSRRLAIVALAVFVGLLVGLPLLRRLVPGHALAVADGFYRGGALVFGGGHVILPLLQGVTVGPGWVSTAQFTAGYGAAQAVPGPLFTFAAYLGAVEGPAPNGPLGATLALGAVFLPGFLLVVGTLPFWAALRKQVGVRAALRGANATVVGLLLAALYTPVWTGAVRRPTDAALALAAFGLLVVGKAPPWMVVLAAMAGGALLAVF